MIKAEIYFYSRTTGKSFRGNADTFKNEGAVQGYIEAMERKGFLLDERYDLIQD